MQKNLCRFMALALVSTGLTVAANAQTIETSINFTVPTQGITADPVRNKIYVVAPDSTQPTDTLAVIDGATDVLAYNIAVPSGALFATVDYLQNRIYVAGCNYNVDPSPCTVTIVDGTARKVIKVVPITTTPGFGLTGIVVNPVNRLVYVANGSDNVINVIDGCLKKVVATIDLGGNSPAAIAINPVRHHLYIPYGTDQVGVVDTHTNTVVRTTTFGVNTVGAAVNVLTGNVFVTDQEIGPSQTGIFDFHGSPITSVTVDDAPLGVDVDPFSNLAFVASTALDDVTVIDGSDNTIKAVVSGVPASYIAVNLVTEKVYVSGRSGVTVLTEK